MSAKAWKKAAKAWRVNHKKLLEHNFGLAEESHRLRAELDAEMAARTCVDLRARPHPMQSSWKASPQRQNIASHTVLSAARAASRSASAAPRREP